MQYFKNSELAETYHIHKTTIANWIEAANDGKLSLTLHESRGRRYHIAKTTANVAVIERLVADRKKHAPNRKVVRPAPRLYKYYSKAQIADIISSLTVHREIPSQYSYIDGGAEYWDRYAQRIMGLDTPNSVRSTVQLLESNLVNLDGLLGGHQKVNVVDLGVGNGLPIRGVLAHLLQQGLLNRYIAIDISAEMLEIARRNVDEWFGGSVAFEGHQRDITCDRFNDLLAEDYLVGGKDGLINVVFLLGGTLSNFRDPGDVLRTINSSMMPNDLLVQSLKPDTERSRRQFDFTNLKTEKDRPASQVRYMLATLGIDDSCYELEGYFDETQKARVVRARLTMALSMEFEFGDETRRVELGKDDSILLLRIKHLTALDVVQQFTTNGFGLLLLAQMADHGYMLTVSDVNLVS